MTQMIEVTVSPNGETTVQTKGFVGPTCREASRMLEAALGLRQAEQLTGEFYTTSQEETSQITRAGWSASAEEFLSKGAATRTIGEAPWNSAAVAAGLWKIALL